MVWVFENHNLKALNIPFKKVVLSGRVNCCGTEGEILEAHGQLICGTEGEIMVIKWKSDSCAPGCVKDMPFKKSNNFKVHKIVSNEGKQLWIENL